VREKQRLLLSPAGELFLGYVEQLLQISEQARAAIVDGAPRGTLRIGTLESTAASRLPPVLSRYHERYPEVRVDLATGTNDALIEAVLSRKLEGAFVVEAGAGSGLDAIPVFDEELVLVAPRAHARIRGPRDARTDTILSFPAGCAYRRRLQGWFAAGGLVAERIMELSSYHAIVACVASGTGIALVPRSVLETVRGGESVSVHPIGARQAKLTTCFVWRKGETSFALTALRDDVVQLRKSRRGA